MLNIDDLRGQVRAHNYITWRELPKRLLCVHIIIAGQYFAGWPMIALINSLSVLVCEFMVWWLIRTTPKVTQISVRRIAAFFVVSYVTHVAHYGAGLILTLHPDFGFFVAGLWWILAALTTSMIMFNTTSAFYVIAALAGFPIAILSMVLAFGHPIEPAGPYSWYLPVTCVLLFLVAAMQNLWDVRDTHRERREARADLLRNLRKMEHMNLHDGLTGLPNRAAFSSDLSEALHRASEANPVAMLMIDLNGFKPINDSYGHEAGDAVLVAVGARMVSALPEAHRGYRLGGDEFAVICEGVGPKASLPLGEALAAAIREPLAYQDKTLLVGASIGVASTTDPGTAPEAICAQADHALYVAKDAVGQSTVHFAPDMAADAITEERRRELEEVIRRRGIVPFYQARFSADGTQFAGLEALARWALPAGELRRPEAFLPELEKAGLMSELTHVMLRQVAEHIALWRAAGVDPGRVSVNIDTAALATQSGREDLDWLLAQYPDSTPHLAFEVTEEVYTGRAGSLVAEALRQFRAQGIEIYLDDFGTGYGAYPHLRAFTPDLLKIDGSLIARLGTGEDAEQVIGGFITMAQGIGAKVVAEGVETEAQRLALMRLGCDYIEGWHLAEELSPEQVLTFLIRVDPRDSSRQRAGQKRRAWRDR